MGLVGVDAIVRVNKQGNMGDRVMYCTGCGRQINAGDKFCPRCGSRVTSLPMPPRAPKQPPAKRNSGALVFCCILLVVFGLASMAGIITIITGDQLKVGDALTLLFCVSVSAAAIIGINKTRGKTNRAAPADPSGSQKVRTSKNRKSVALIPVVIAAAIVGITILLTLISQTRYGGLIFLLCSGALITIIFALRKRRLGSASKVEPVAKCQKCKKQIDANEVVCPYCGQETPLYEEEVKKMRALDDKAPVRIPVAVDADPPLSINGDNANELAENLHPDASKRKKAQQAGEEASRAAMEALLRNAAAMPNSAEDGRAPQAYQAPPLSCLAIPRSAGAQSDRGEEDMIARKLVYTLESFGVAVELVGRSQGPNVTRYELRPAEGVKISKIASLADDIALRLAVKEVHIAHIPGKTAVGVEVPNRVRAIVYLREIIDSDIYRVSANKSKLTVALGKDIVGDLVCADLAKLPHLLIAGTTGSGKSVCMNALILSLMYNASPEDVKMVMVDPKQVEFNVYSGIPHLLVPVANDPMKAAGVLRWAVNEMEKRYTTIQKKYVRDIDSYTDTASLLDDLKRLSRVVIFIDELSDLMMVAHGDVEDSIRLIARKGRTVGFHLVVAAERPSADVITNAIKSNLPGRIVMRMASWIDSRTIINSTGAERLLGNGDMLFSVNDGSDAIRVQGCYVSDVEIHKVVSFIKEKNHIRESCNEGAWEEIDRFAAQAARGKKKGGGFDLSGEDGGEEDDPMLEAAIEVVVNAQLASTTMLQKKLKLGYARASRLVDLLEARGVVGPPEGAKPRKVLMSHTQWQEYNAK